MANEKRLIDANALIEFIRRNYCDGCNSYDGVKCRACEHDDEILMLEEAPTVDAVEVVHAHWEPEGNTGYLRCSHCKDVYINEEWLTDGRWSYCPNCGAKMDGGHEYD